MATDQPLPIRSDSEDVFEIGERTIFRLQNQASPFDPDELGTMIVRPHTAKTDTPTALDPLARIEQKLDALSRRLDSIDAMLARIASR